MKFWIAKICLPLYYLWVHICSQFSKIFNVSNRYQFYLFHKAQWRECIKLSSNRLYFAVSITKIYVFHQHKMNHSLRVQTNPYIFEPVVGLKLLPLIVPIINETFEKITSKTLTPQHYFHFTAKTVLQTNATNICMIIEDHLRNYYRDKLRTTLHKSMAKANYSTWLSCCTALISWIYHSNLI